MYLHHWRNLPACLQFQLKITNHVSGSVKFELYGQNKGHFRVSFNCYNYYDFIIDIYIYIFLELYGF